MSWSHGMHTGLAGWLTYGLTSRFGLPLKGTWKQGVNYLLCCWQRDSVLVSSRWIFFQSSNACLMGPLLISIQQDWGACAIPDICGLPISMPAYLKMKHNGSYSTSIKWAWKCITHRMQGVFEWHCFPSPHRPGNGVISPAAADESLCSAVPSDRQSEPALWALSQAGVKQPIRPMPVGRRH